jgi:transposase
MPKQLRLAPHHTTEELGRLYRQAHDPVARSHWHILWRVSQGDSAPRVSATTGYSSRWVRTLVSRYNARGDAGVGDGRHANPGGAPLLDATALADLDRALDIPPPDGGLWNGRKVAAWIEARIGRQVGRQRGTEYLRRLDRTPQRPRPRHADADADEQAAFKQTSPPT